MAIHQAAAAGDGMTVFKKYGCELILDLHGCSVEQFAEAGVEEFCKTLCASIGMQAEDFHIWASDPKDFGTDPPHLHGVSAVQFITTSSIVIHTLTKLRAVFINLFTCGAFDESDADYVCRYSSDFFDGQVGSCHKIVRGYRET